MWCGPRDLHSSSALLLSIIYEYVEQWVETIFYFSPSPRQVWHRYLPFPRSKIASGCCLKLIPVVECLKLKFGVKMILLPSKRMASMDMNRNARYSTHSNFCSMAFVNVFSSSSSSPFFILIRKPSSWVFNEFVNNSISMDGKPYLDTIFALLIPALTDGLKDFATNVADVNKMPNENSVCRRSKVVYFIRTWLRYDDLVRRGCCRNVTPSSLFEPFCFVRSSNVERKFHLSIAQL